MNKTTSNKESIFEHLERVCELIPAALYWVNSSYRYVGANKKALIACGVSKREDFVGKTPHELFVKDVADRLQDDFIKVMKTGILSVQEDWRFDPTIMKIRYFSATRTALRNENGDIVGLIGTSIEITAEKEADLIKSKTEKLEFENKLIFEHLDQISESIPAAFYWIDLNYRYVGANKRALIACDAAKREDLIGKTAHEFFTKDIADRLQQDFIKIITMGGSSQHEDIGYDPISGERKYFSATRSALRNKNGEIIGLVGTSIEITAEKETARLKQENERLELENKSKQLLNDEQEKFKKIVGQMLHDIQSPLSSLSTIVTEESSALAENTRITLRNATYRIEDIAKNLLSTYENRVSGETESVKLLVSLALFQIMSEKRYEYYDNKINFEIEVKPTANFAFIKINPTDFKRMISNVINNAVEAIKSKLDGKVKIKLMANPENVAVFVTDNGSGMPKHIIDKFNKGEAVTEGKENGRGIGLIQVRDTLNTYEGTCDIYVKEGISTEIVIRFPIIPAPHWIASEIKIDIDDTIIILDDDDSIHGAWKSKFAPFLEQYPTLQPRYYNKGKDVIDYINSLSIEQKQNTFLLTDYELLNQDMNGIDVVICTKIHRAILVTSHASNAKIQELVTKSGIKTLPKELTSAVTIHVDKKIPKWSRIVDMVWIEDKKEFVDDLVRMYYGDSKVDVYYDPHSFLEDVHQYPLNTRFILDTYYDAPNGTPYLIDGLALASKLHDMGYTKLILFAGQAIPAKQTPDYLTVILKSDLINIKKLNTI